MSRVEKLNELLRQEIAEYVNRELPIVEFMITIVHVSCSPDLKNASILFSVIPEKFTGTALRQLRSVNSALAKHLKQKLRIHHIPKFNWVFDPTEKEAAIIEDYISHLDEMEAE